MKKIERFQITGMTISGFKSYEEPTELAFGSPTVITGGNGRGKTSIADAIAFAVTGLPFFGERGLDRLHNEVNGDLYICLRFVDETGTPHELVRTRRGNRMTISYDGYEIRQMDLTDLFGEKDAFLSIFNPLYFIEELGDEGKKLLEMHLPMISQAEVMAELSEPVRRRLERETILSPDAFLKAKREEIRNLEGEIIYLTGQRDQAAAQNSSLAARYNREAASFKALRAGMACPICHRPITGESLPGIQADVQKTAAALLAEGKEQQRQIGELEQLEQRARETFAQFKADDLKKWPEEAAALEAQCRKLDGDARAQSETLRQEIQSLTLDLEYGNLSQQEFDRLTACREELSQCEAELTAIQSLAEEDVSRFDRQILQDQAEITELKKLIADAVIYSSKRDEMTFSALKLNRVEISLYDVVKSTGERKDAFKFNYSGRRYDRLSLSEKIRAGLEVSQLVMRLTGRYYPVFVDNMESVDGLENVRPTGQVIFAKCVSKAPLQVRPVQPIPAAGTKAA